MVRDRQGMLQPHRITHTVGIAEIEQVASGERTDVVHRGQIDGANHVRLAIGDKQRVLVPGQTGRLSERAVVEPPVLTCLEARPGVRKQEPPLGVQYPQLMHARHGNEQQRTDLRQVPRRTDRCGHRTAPRCTAPGLVRVPGQGPHSGGVEVYLTNQVIAGISDQETAILRTHRHPLGACKARLREGPIVGARMAGANPRDRDTRQRRDHNLVVTGVCHEHAIPRGIDCHLARKRQPARWHGRLGPHLGLWSSTKRSAVAEHLRHCGDRLLKLRQMPFARRATHQISGRVDQRQRRPRPHGVFPPDAKIRIIRHGMRNVVSRDDLAQVLRTSLVGELGRVNTDDHQMFRVRRGEPLEPRQLVQAIDAPVGPELEQDDLAAKRRQRQRCRDVQPVHGADELRRPNRHVARFFGRGRRLVLDVVSHPRARSPTVP